MKTERMYNMLYKNNKITINLDSVIVVIEENDFKYDLTVMLNGGTILSLHFDTLLDRVLFLKALRTNTISEFHKFENINSELMICNPIYNSHTESMYYNTKLSKPINGNFIINMLAIDFYSYINSDNQLKIKTGNIELILNNITREEYDKFDNAIIKHFGLYKDGEN